MSRRPKNFKTYREYVDFKYPGLIDALKAGEMTYAQIGKTFGLSGMGYVVNHLRDESGLKEFPLRHRGRRHGSVVFRNDRSLVEQKYPGLVAGLEAGKPYREIGEPFGISRETVRQIAILLGFPRRQEEIWANKDHIRALLAVHSNRKIARMTGAALETIAKLRAQTGISAPGRKQKVHPWEHELGVLPDCQIARKYSSSVQIVFAKRKKLGIPPAPETAWGSPGRKGPRPNVDPSGKRTVIDWNLVHQLRTAGLRWGEISSHVGSNSMYLSHVYATRILPALKTKEK